MGAGVRKCDTGTRVLHNRQCGFFVFIGNRLPEKHVEVAFQGDIDHGFNRVNAAFGRDVGQAAVRPAGLVHEVEIVPFGRARLATGDLFVGLLIVGGVDQFALGFRIAQRRLLAVQRQLEGLGPLREVEISPGTLNLFLEGVKLQFLHYPYRLLEPTVSWQKVPISSVVDIACTKLQTVAMRGSKKDFIDLYFLLRNYPLAVLFQKMKSKYSNVDYSQTHILKSLVYFADADNQPMPKMHTLVSWPEVKKEITKLVKELKL